MYGPPNNGFPPHYRGTIVLESMSTGDVGQPPTTTVLCVPTKREANPRSGQASCRLHTHTREGRIDLFGRTLVILLIKCACNYTSGLYLQPNYGIIQCEIIMKEIRDSLARILAVFESYNEGLYTTKTQLYIYTLLD